MDDAAHHAPATDDSKSLENRITPLAWLRYAPCFWTITGAYGHLMQKMSWLIQPRGVLMVEHVKILAEYPSVQHGKRLDVRAGNQVNTNSVHA